MPADKIKTITKLIAENTGRTRARPGELSRHGDGAALQTTSKAPIIPGSIAYFNEKGIKESH